MDFHRPLVWPHHPFYGTLVYSPYSTQLVSSFPPLYRPSITFSFRLSLCPPTDTATRLSALPETHQIAIQSLAEDERCPIDLVQELYLSELTDLQTDARVTQYLPIVTSRRVRERLRRLDRDVRLAGNISGHPGNSALQGVAIRGCADPLPDPRHSRRG